MSMKPTSTEAGPPFWKAPPDPMNRPAPMAPPLEDISQYTCASLATRRPTHIAIICICLPFRLWWSLFSPCARLSRSAASGEASWYCFSPNAGPVFVSFIVQVASQQSCRQRFLMSRARGRLLSERTKQGARAVYWGGTRLPKPFEELAMPRRTHDKRCAGWSKKP
jgi:hypothetical protein